MDRSDLLFPNFFMAPAVRKARQKPRLRVQWCEIGIPSAGAWSLSLPQGHGRSMETKPALMPGFRPSKQRPSSISWTRTQINNWNRQGRKCAYRECGHTRTDIVTFWALPTALPPKYLSQASTKTPPIFAASRSGGNQSPFLYRGRSSNNSPSSLHILWLGKENRLPSLAV